MESVKDLDFCLCKTACTIFEKKIFRMSYKGPTVRQSSLAESYPSNSPMKNTKKRLENIVCEHPKSKVQLLSNSSFRVSSIQNCYFFRSLPVHCEITPWESECCVPQDPRTDHQAIKEAAYASIPVPRRKACDGEDRTKTMDGVTGFLHTVYIYRYRYVI
jgi:hypothetical protein